MTNSASQNAELLDALQDACSEMENYDGLIEQATADEPGYYEQWTAALAKVQAAIARAKGGVL